VGLRVLGNMKDENSQIVLEKTRERERRKSQRVFRKRKSEKTISRTRESSYAQILPIFPLLALSGFAVILAL
jgi:hypothetical protein